MNQRAFPTLGPLLVMAAIAFTCTSGCAGAKRTRQPASTSVHTNAASTTPTTTTAQPNPAEQPASFAALPWDFEGATGIQLTSQHHRLFTTGSTHWMREGVAAFCDVALLHYRTVFCELPEPPRPLDIYLFADRPQWQRYTELLMKEHAAVYLSLGRGGYTTRGTAVLYDLGYDDTFAMLSHEGWHQYTQVAFKHPLPTWLEEGIAAWMEGRQQSPGSPIVFDAWANPHRMFSLRRAARRDALVPLIQLIDRSPQHFLQRDDEGLLTYYAQVWLLVHFLNEGEGGRYRDGLRRVLRDAANGRITSTVLTALNASPPGERRRLATSQLGPGVILTYFNSDLNAFALEYDAFVADVLKRRR
ncbi:MAG: hypothetical protein ACR2GY_14645 [Phycisphaerales bacterium]